MDAWEAIERSRLSGRPGAADLLDTADDVTPLWGPIRGEHHPGLVIALARFGKAAAVVIGQDRIAQDRSSCVNVRSLREARRAMTLAEELRMPCLTIVDTRGAALSREAEEEGIAQEIARCAAALISLKTSTLCVLLGQGSGAAAIALLPADKVICAESGWLAPLAPEGAAAILYRDSARASEIVDMLGIRAVDLVNNGVADQIVDEGCDVSREPEEFLYRLASLVEHSLVELSELTAEERLVARYKKYRCLGIRAS